MIFVLPDILPPDVLAKVRSLSRGTRFIDGKATAGVSVQHAKRNDELEGGSEAAQSVNTMIGAALKANNDFQVIAIPYQLSPFLVSRYGQGMHYGDHTDNAVLSGGGAKRSDMSMTIFLSDPEDYDGGELVLNTDLRPERYKLPAGHCVIYPTYFLHRVEQVTRGQRLAAVGWIQSAVRNPFQRQILIDLAITLGFFLKTTAEKQRHPEYIRLEKVYNNLKRQWVEF